MPRSLAPLGFFAIFSALLIGWTVHAREQPASDWTLVFQDDFERSQLGSAWTSNDAQIRDGELLIGLKGPACAKLMRSFPADVRVEFTARAYEKRPPCDLSVTLAAERYRVMSWNYLLAFGGVNNTVNKLTGGRQMPPVRHENPDRLVEPGETYRIVAVKEGQRLSLTVDGEVLLKGVDEEVMGGPGFDAVGLVTWNGMYVDQVRVYERREPHPDTPHYVQALEPMLLTLDSKGRLIVREDGLSQSPPGLTDAVEAYHRGDLDQAEAGFQRLEGEARAAGLAWVYGDLRHDERPGDFPLVARLFEDLHRAKPEDQRLADSSWAASLFGRIRPVPRAEKECSLLLSLGPENNPFYDKAKLYRARYLRANGQEGADGRTLATARRMFEELKAKAPDNPLLRQLTGEAIPWGEELIADATDVPRWAGLLRELYARQLAILDWWFTERQFPDGQLGGGWGDDVEILRSWAPLASISNARPSVRDGIERLCEGVWNHVLEDGFDRTLGDVEHSSEPSADTLPNMLVLRYGDPFWQERNLASCRRIRDIYTGIDEKGCVRFKSGHFGGERVSEHVQHGGDNYYCSRPMKHFLWPAWYGNAEAAAFYLNWVRGWVEATMATKYTKPAGVPPANIWYPSGDIAPPNGAPWNDPTFNIYGCCWIGNFWIQDTFLAGYALSGDADFLRPIQAWMRYYESELPEGSSDRPDIDDDPLAWAIQNAKDTWNCGPTLVEYRWLTGDSRYDALFGKHRPSERLHMPGSLDDFVARLERALKGLRVNFDLHTREVLQTDRAHLAGTEVSFSAYTGAVRLWGDAGMPTMAATWEAPHADFAAVVPCSLPDRLRVWIYSFAESASSFGVRLWRLVPGEYEVTTGELSGEGGFSRRCSAEARDRFTVRHRAEVYWFKVPPKREFAVEFRLLRRFQAEAPLPDPAIGEKDTSFTTGDGAASGTVSATVHNLGQREVPTLEVALVLRSSRVSGSQPAKETTLGTQTICLPGSTDLQPSRVRVTFQGVRPPSPSSGVLELRLDPKERVMEIYELNNRALVPTDRSP